jgi:Na+/proline symporter
MDFITQLVSMPGGSNVVSILFISGLGLLVLVGLGGWGERDFNKNWKTILLVLAVVLMIIAAFCLYYLTTNSPKEIEQIVEKGSGNKPLMENNTKEVDTIGLINMFLTIIMIAFIPIGGLLILFSILYAQKLSEKQQKDLRTYGWVIIIISLLMFSTVGD